MTRHVGFTGTQAGMTERQMLEVGNILTHLGATDLHHGDCIGSDADAHKIASEALDMNIHIHPPTVRAKQALCPARFKRDVVYPEKPYLERNRDIVDSGDILIATPKELTETLRSGTWSTVRHARKQRKHIYIVWPDGTVSEEFPSHSCAFCEKHGATWRAEVQGPDDSYLVYRFWCNAMCHANWGTGQPLANATVLSSRQRKLL